MSSNRVGGSTTPTYIQPHTPVQSTPSAASQAVQQTSTASSVNLFDASTYAKAVSVADGTGGTVSLPTLSDDQAAQAQTLFAKVDDDKRNEVNAASTALGQALIQQMLSNPSTQTVSTDDAGNSTVQGSGKVSMANLASAKVVNASSLSVTANASSRAATGVDATGVTVTKVSPALVSAATTAASTYSKATNNAATGTDAVSAATYMGLVGMQGELTTYANDMNATTKQKQSLDADASELNAAISEWPAGTDTQTLPQVTQNSDGTVTVTQVAMTKTEAQASLDSAKSASEGLGNDQQLQSIKLQSMMSNYSNAVNQLSNILKASYDAEKNTLGNVRY